MEVSAAFSCLLLFSLAAQCIGAGNLGSYNINPESISVSGLSAGAFMAVQMHVTYSKTFSGVGVVAGGPYWCAQASLTVAVGPCMETPALINVAYLQQITRNTALTGYADPTSNMKNDKVFLFVGTEDSTVVPGVVSETEKYYQEFVDSSNIKTEYSVIAEHGFPTVMNGGPCNKQNKETYINKCDYDAAYAILNHIYGGLQKPVYPNGQSLDGSIVQFDQTEFFNDGAFAPYKGLDNFGYLFVPTSCQDGAKSCRLHVALHGCLQGKELIGETYVRETGYNEVAALNDIIVLYPQVKKDILLNPNGCFDWWGYTGPSYASNLGDQMIAIRKMVERISNV